jgi:hypothetical protein
MRKTLPQTGARVWRIGDRVKILNRRISNVGVVDSQPILDAGGYAYRVRVAEYATALVVSDRHLASLDGVERSACTEVALAARRRGGKR